MNSVGRSDGAFASVIAVLAPPTFVYFAYPITFVLILLKVATFVGIIEGVDDGRISFLLILCYFVSLAWDLVSRKAK